MEFATPPPAPRQKASAGAHPPLPRHEELTDALAARDQLVECHHAAQRYTELRELTDALHQASKGLDGAGRAALASHAAGARAAQDRAYCRYEAARGRAQRRLSQLPACALWLVPRLNRWGGWAVRGEDGGEAGCTAREAAQELERLLREMKARLLRALAGGRPAPFWAPGAEIRIARAGANGARW
jgi:hypothetical protein